MKQHILPRKWIGAMLALAMVGMWAGGVFAQDATRIRIIPDNVTVYVGQTVDVTLQVENIANLYRIELNIVFDPHLLEVVDADPARPGIQVAAGGFLKPDYEPVNDVSNGVIDYAVEQISPTPPASGSGALLRFTFRAIGSGASDIRIDNLHLADQGGQGIASPVQNGRVVVQAGSVSDPPPTPVPPTPVPATPAPPPTAAPQPPFAPPSGYNCATVQGYHIVRRGETLYAIARAYATNPYAIGACNPTINPRRIHAGNHLAIPYAPWTPPPGPTAERQFAPSLIPAPVPPPAPGCRAHHVVQPRDTLTAIGLRYGANIWDIARANRIYNLHFINTGQVLCIP